MPYVKFRLLMEAAALRQLTIIGSIALSQSDSDKSQLTIMYLRDLAGV